MILRFWINTKSMHLTMTGEIGKPIYMSPELLKDEESLYTSSNDVYAFAIYFQKDGVIITLMKHFTF